MTERVKEQDRMGEGEERRDTKSSQGEKGGRIKMESAVLLQTPHENGKTAQSLCKLILSCYLRVHTAQVQWQFQYHS